MFDYEILKSGSDGNCLIINKKVAIDMGISFKQIQSYLKELKVILLTHIHSDHFQKNTIRKIAYEKPTIKFVCRNWLVKDLLELGVSKKNIYVLKNQKTYDLGLFKVMPIDTYHDVENTSYRLDFKPITMYYATDTSKLDYLECLKGLNYYFVENNYSRKELEERIKEKEEKGEFIYEYRVLDTHMSEEDINSFLIEMMTDESKYVYCHQHKKKEVEECEV
jgi:Cft2 family RNA processing exonuclease